MTAFFGLFAAFVLLPACPAPEDDGPDDTATQDMSSDTSGTRDMGSANDTATSPNNTTMDEDMAQGCIPDEEPTEHTVCSPDDDHVYLADSCGMPAERETRCSSSTQCEINSGDGQAYCACPLTGGTTCKFTEGRANLYNASHIEKERECASAEPDPADLLEECGFGSVCFQDEGFNGGVPSCHRSIDPSQSDKPYYDHGCGMFSEWLRHPTKLEIDCRCRYVSDGSGSAGGTAGNSTGNGFADPNNPDPANGGFPAGPILNCAAVSAMEDNTWPVQYGQGPSFNAWKQQNSSGSSWLSGDVDPSTREMYGLIRWTNPQYSRSATVVAWDLDTGDRRVISGLYPDRRLGQMPFGSGYMSPAFLLGPGRPTEQPLTGGNTIRLADDGYLYVFGGGTGEGPANTREIVRVDRTTGERTLVWMAQNDKTGDITATYGQCFRPNALTVVDESVALNAQAFEVGPDGTFYVSFRGTREGDGIATISADGKTCTIINRWGGRGHNPGGGIDPAPVPDPVGMGPLMQFPVRGLLYHDGLVYGVSNDELYSFDPATGQRALESFDRGTYGGMGYANMFWDPTREVIWAVGTVSRYVGSIVDLKTGRVESVYGDSGRQDYGASQTRLNSVYAGARSVDGTMLSNGHSINYGAFVLDPDDPNIAYAVLKVGGLMKLELSTFNNYVHSW